MPDFIENNLEAILEEWDGFAAEQLPAAEGMTAEALRDLAGLTLRAVAQDMRTKQSEEERHDKSRGGRPVARSTDVTDSAHAHSAERFANCFTLPQLAAEYRALRASVVRRWRAEMKCGGEDDLEELTRFNEAIDESLFEAMSGYNVRIDDARNILNGVLAHDLRSPLGAISTILDVMLHDDSLGAQHMRSIIRARSSATRMKGMIDDLLDFTRTRLGTGLPMAVAECDMGRIVKDVIEEQQAFHPQVAFRCETSGDLKGRWDSSRIQQMIANLLDNAATHAAEGSPVCVAAKGPDDDIIVSVQNEGAVIPPEDQRVIFNPLRRVVVREREGRRGAGMGLGLYIARQISEAHGGGIRLESSAQAGTIFTVRLPRRRRRAAEIADLT